MNLSGVEVIPASQQAVWDALNDQEVLKACIPGCETMERTSDTAFGMVMNAAVGPVKARFTGKLAISESDPPNGYVLSFEGTGGAAGFGKGSASVSLVPVLAGTELKYAATAQIGGKIAQVGARLVDGVAKRMADEFFSRFSARFPPREAAEERVSPPASGAPATTDPAPSPTANRTWLWVAGCIVAALVLGAIWLTR